MARKSEFPGKGSARGDGARAALVLALSAGATVRKAAKAARINPETYYAWRRASPAFAQRADDAIRAFRSTAGASARNYLLSVVENPKEGTDARVRAADALLRDVARGETRHSETAHTGKVSMEITQRMEKLAADLAKKRGAFERFRAGLSAQHESAAAVGASGTGGDGQSN